ncbi:hypothetical protein KTO58_16160 [Chitinophaga pendula]|uniref:hypothetical protein n=1 Tax=Chitinophaga TaxID=79328 RepID=UPI000BB0133C|nr:MULTISPECIES: hypothetical protein [Chitinophaga]ASZ11754.1 hypothetical protein CK934_12690 [Chitinophaga sp. MD30]UCJ05227.1 hypothetical protein KTO58_16160 [Chitinophaga pendula]
MTTVVILTLCFLTALSCKIKKVKAPFITAITWYIHLLFLFAVICCALLWLGEYSFKGAFTNRIILSLYAGSGMIVYGLSPKEISGKKVYLAAFFAFPFLLLIGLLLPFTRIFTIMLSVYLLADGNVKRYPVDNQVCLQTYTVPIVSRYPAFSIIEHKYWLFEKTTHDVISRQINPHDIRLQKLNTDSIHITLSDNTRYDTIISLKAPQPGYERQ